jgi:hypothetical protein
MIHGADQHKRQINGKWRRGIMLPLPVNIAYFDNRRKSGCPLPLFIVRETTD